MSNISKKRVKHFFTHFFKDKKGDVVIVQTPNWPLYIALAFYVLGFFPVALLQVISAWGTTLTLLYWSYLEIRFGVNSWRKLLGLIVAGSILLPRIWLTIT